MMTVKSSKTRVWWMVFFKDEFVVSSEFWIRKLCKYVKKWNWEFFDSRTNHKYPKAFSL